MPRHPEDSSPQPIVVSPFAGLWWPRLIKAGAISLRPERLAVAIAVVLGLHLLDLAVGALVGLRPIGGLTDAAIGGVGIIGSLLQRMTGLEAMAPLLAGESIGDAGGSGGGAITLAVFSSVVSLVVAVLAWTAISRSAAIEFSGGSVQGLTPSLMFAFRHGWSALFAVVLPIVVAAGLIAIVLAASWLLLVVPYVRVAGALVYGITLIGTSLAALLAVGLAGGAVMLVPAAASEGAGGLDGVQRVLAYVVHRPMRLAWYLLVLAANGFVLVLIVGSIAAVTTLLLGQITVAAHGNRLAESETTLAIVRWWLSVPSLLVLAMAASYTMSAGSVLYLAMRRVCDGQDPSELWDPATVPDVVFRAGGTVGSDGSDA